MARAQHLSELQDRPAAAGPEQWDELRDELQTLLDQVNDRQKQAPRPDIPDRAAPEAVIPAHRLPAADDRHRAALQSVQQAVRRFNEPEEAPPMPSSSPERLQSAIDQIRASQGRAHARATRQAPAPYRQDPAAGSAQLGELKSAIAGIGARMERFETALSGQGHSGRAVEDIAQQMEQLTGVVELLAASVGEQSHIKRVEAQIARLAEQVGSGPDLDVDVVSERIRVLSDAFDNLSALQADQAEFDMPRHVGAIEGSMRAVQDRVEGLDFNAVEASVRSIYDRIDQLEQNVSVPLPAIERLSRELAEFTEAMRQGKGPAVTSSLVTRVDALNARLSEIEDEGQPTDGLKEEMDGLRHAVISAFEPRFSALENQLGSLADKVSAPKDDGESRAIAGLEVQIRRLADRLDQTGAEISTLQTLYAEGQPAPEPPDLGQLADLVAAHTHSAIEKASAAAQPAGIDSSALEALESRLSHLFETHRGDDQPDFSGLEHSILKVNARLENLEATLRQDASDRESGIGDYAPAPAPAASVPAPEKPYAPAAPAMPEAAEAFVEDAVSAEPDEMANEDDEFGAPMARRHLHPGLDDAEPVPAPASRRPSEVLGGLKDQMPRPPSDEAPLNAPAFPDPYAEDQDEPMEFRRVPVPSALMVDPGDYAVLDHGTDAAEPEIDDEFGVETSARSGAVSVPRFEDESVTPPPAPTSDFASDSQQSFARDKARAEAAAETADTRGAVTGDPSDGPAASRSTFIAAARRAAQQSNAPEAEIGSNSLIGKALARFAKKSDPAAEGGVGPGRADLHSEPAVAEAPEPKAGRGKTDKAEAPKAGNADMALDDLDDLDDIEVKENLFSRYKRPLLLGAALVAISLLTLNLVTHKLGGSAGSSATPPPPAASDTQTPAMQSGEPAAGSMTTPDQSTEPADAPPINAADEPPKTSDMPVGAIGPVIPPHDDDVRVIDPTLMQDMPAPLQLANFTPGQALSAPATAAMPPEAVGPEALRQAAANGDPRAEFEVAAIFAEGRTVTQDLGAAAGWYQKAAAEGFAPAAYRLGNMYENGSGVSKDLEQARVWYEKAAELGNRMSMHNLASILASGQLGKQEFAEAAGWFEKAAALGLTDSQFNLGMLYARGLGVSQDMEQSYKWFSIAALSGDADAAKARDDIARSLAAPVVGQLQTEVADWAPQKLDMKANFAPIGTWTEDFDPGPEIENSDVIKRVQAALGKLGYDAGTADGLIGPNTRDAIRAFETDTGMNESGTVNPRLLAVLGSQPV